MNRRQFLSTVSATLVPGAEQTASTRPNIVLILSDDMGYADLSCYGSPDIRTPHLDRLAREGVKFTDAYSNGPVCTPTRAALMTGMYQQRFGLEWALSPGQKGYGLLPQHRTVATALKQAGYRTAMYGKWHLGYEPEFGPNRHGFDDYFGILSGNADFYSHKEVNGEADLYENTTPVERKGYLTDLLADRAESFVKAQSDAAPFFLYLAFNAVHWPFQAPDRPDDVRDRSTWQNGTRADYARMMERMDAAVGRVLTALEQKGLAKNTLVIFTNDNGGERLSDNRPLFHHKATLWEGGIRVPALMRWPGRVPAGKTTGQPAMSMDFAATILAAAGVQPAPDTKLDGMDLLPVVTGQRAPVERTFFWRIDRVDRKQKAVRMGDWKYVRDGSIEQLFNLRKDISEHDDLSYSNPDVVVKLRQAVNAWEQELAKAPPPKVIR